VGAQVSQIIKFKMKKFKFGFFLTMMLLTVLFLNSCEKGENVDNISTEIGNELQIIYDEYKTSILESAKGQECELFFSQVRNLNGVLVFSDKQHFEDVLECLELSVDKYNDIFEAEYQDLTDEEIDIKEEEIGFNEDQPLIDFEKRFDFISLRKELDDEINIWLDNEELDEANDPDDHFIIDEDLRTLLSPNSLVIIGNETIDFYYAREELRLGICIFKDCCHTGTSKDFFYYNGGNRRFKVRVALRHFIVGSKLKGKIKHFRRKSNGRWKKSRTKLFVQVGGQGRDSNCALGMAPNLGAVKGPKRRKRLKAKYKQFQFASAIHGQDNDMWCVATATNNQIPGSVQLDF
jgi:hypothetical protein